ncbi:MAG: response regulator [Dehalococcoidia bacterium]
MSAQQNIPTRGRIVVVEDDRRVQHMLRTVLRLEHYEVDCIADGQVALYRITACVPDLLVLDLLIPGLDGWEVVRRLRNNPRTAGLPVLVVSSVADLEEVGETIDVNDYLAKPFRVEKLLSKVQLLLNAHDAAA